MTAKQTRFVEEYLVDLCAAGAASRSAAGGLAADAGRRCQRKTENRTAAGAVTRVHLGANRKPAGAGNPPAIERNPAADRVPALDPDDLIRLASYHVSGAACGCTQTPGSAPPVSRQPMRRISPSSATALPDGTAKIARNNNRYASGTERTAS